MVTLLLLIVMATGCSGQVEGHPDGTQPTCAAIAFFDGLTYLGRNVPVHPVAGEVLGQAQVPGCNDTGQSQAPPDQFVTVARLPGVDPSIAVVEADNPQVMYTRANLKDLPPEVMAYFDVPTCQQADSPITLAGTWLGIIQADGHTELDMVPPYNVSMLVLHASSATYLRAELSIHVTASLGMPLTHADVHAVLWKGGTIRVIAECDGTGFVARSVEATPP